MLRDRVLFLRDRSLECWRLANVTRDWSLDLPFGPVDDPIVLSARYAEARLEFRGETGLQRRAYDVASGRPESPPDLGWEIGNPVGPHVLLWREDGDGLHFRLRGTDWRRSLHRERRYQWHRQEGAWIVVHRRDEEEANPELLIFRAGDPAPPRLLKLPGPAAYGLMLMGGQAYQWSDHSRFTRNRFEDKPLDPPPPYIWNHLVVDLATGTVVDQESIPYSETLRRQARLTGAYAPVTARRVFGLDPLGWLVVEPDRVMLKRKEILWRRGFEQPHVFYSDADIMGIRTATELAWLRSRTGEVLSTLPLASDVAHSWDRHGDVLIAHGWNAKDTTLGIWSARSGRRLVAFRPGARPQSRTVAINWPYFWDRVSTSGGLAAVSARLAFKDGPDEVWVFDLETGERVATVPLDDGVVKLLLKDRWLVVQTKNAVRVFQR